MSFYKVLKNTFLVIVSEQFSRVINFFQVIIIIRYFSNTEYGILNTIQSLPAIFIVLTELGLNSIMLRKISSDSKCIEDIFNKVLNIKITLSFGYILFMALISYVLKYDNNVRYMIMITSLSVLFCDYNQVIMSVMRAMEVFVYESIYKIVNSSFLLLIIIVIKFGNFNLIDYLYAILIYNMLISMLIYFIFSNKIKLNIKFIKFNIYKKLIKSSLPFALLNIINPVYTQIDVIVLSKLSSFESVGIYSAAIKIISMLAIIPYSLTKALFPSLSKYNYEDKIKFENIFLNSYKIVGLIGFPISAGLYILSDKIIYLLYSSRYNDAIIPLKIMSIMLLASYFRSIFNVGLYATGLENIGVKILLVGTIINIILDIIFVKYYNIIGVCIAALISETFILLGSILYFKSRISFFNIIVFNYKVLFSTAFMSVILLLTNNMLLYYQIIIGIVLYVIIIVSLKLFKYSEYLNIINYIKNDIK